MWRLYYILLASMGIALLGFTLHGCPMVAFALDGTTPVEVTNGDVSLYCASNNRLLGKETGDVDCLANLPEGTRQKSLIAGPYRTWVNLYVDTLGQVVNVPGVGDLISTMNVNVTTSTPRAAAMPQIFGAVETAGTYLATDTYAPPFAQATLTKESGSGATYEIDAGDRVKHDLRGVDTADPGSGYPYDAGSCVIEAGFFMTVVVCGKVMKADDDDRAIGLAVTSADDSDTSVEVYLGIATDPVDITATSPLSLSSSNVMSLSQAGIKHLAIMQTQSSGAAADRYFPVIGSELDAGNSSLVRLKATTVLPAGYITSPITCWCDDAVASSETVEIELCINDTTDCASSDTDVVSECTISATETECTDGSWSGDYAVASGEDFYYYADRSGGTGCQLYQCQFSYTQSEY